MAKEESKPRGRTANPDAKNGISPPTKGTAAATVWAVCEKLHVKGDVKPAAVLEAVLAKNPELNPATIKTQLARWRQFNGLVTPRA